MGLYTREQIWQICGKTEWVVKCWKLYIGTRPEILVFLSNQGEKMYFISNMFIVALCVPSFFRDLVEIIIHKMLQQYSHLKPNCYLLFSCFSLVFLIVRHWETLFIYTHPGSPTFCYLFSCDQWFYIPIVIQCAKNVSVWIEHAMCFLACRASVYLIPWLTSGCDSWEKAGCSERPLGRTAKEM